MKQIRPDYFSIYQHKTIRNRFTETDILGCKFHFDAKNKVMADAEEQLQWLFKNHNSHARLLPVIVCELPFERPIGFNTLVTLADHAGKKPLAISRPSEMGAAFAVTVFETTEFPETKVATVVAGPYGDSGKWGIYTVYPGSHCPAFPNDPKLDGQAQRDESKAFWDTHGFLATSADIARALDEAKNFKPRGLKQRI